MANRWILWSIAVVGAVVTVAALYVCYVMLQTPAVGSLGESDRSSFGSVAVLLLVGIAAFVGILNLLSFSAGQLHILNPQQAFGLPDGSVRAILTIAFIVLVGVLASYLVTSSDRAPYAKTSILLQHDLTNDQATAAKKDYANADGLVALRPLTEPKDHVDLVFYARVDHRLSEDVAKQILTILSTILAAMIGFYFGAKPGESDPNASKRAQSLAAIENLVAGAPDPEDLKRRADALINGRLRDRPEQLKQAQSLRKQLDELAATLVTANSARLSIDTTADQMQNAAASAKTVVPKLQDIAKQLDQLEKV